jgi:hypothetical protein
MYQNEHLYLEINSNIEEDVEDLIISLHGYFSFIHKIYLKIYLYIEPYTYHKYSNIFNLLLTSKIYRIYQNEYEEEEEIDRKRIELKSTFSPIHLYEKVCNVPYSIRLYEKEIKNRDLLKEEEYYLQHIQHYQNYPYIFCTSQYHDDNHKSLPIYIISNPYLHDNIYDTYWYQVNERSMYQTIKIMENAEEIHLNSQDKRWLEWIYFLDLKKVKRLVIYYHNEEELNNLKKYYPWIHLFYFIELKENKKE